MNASVTWNLRKLMAEKNMFHTTDLVPLLAEQGVRLSKEQVYRLVTGTPQRLNLKVLSALCRIFECSPNDLIQVNVPVPVTRPSAGEQDE